MPTSRVGESTGHPASPEQVQAVHAFIRQRIARRDPEAAGKVRIICCGSVKVSNADALFATPDIDGVLVGGASLATDEFVAICRAANRDN